MREEHNTLSFHLPGYHYTVERAGRGYPYADERVVRVYFMEFEVARFKMKNNYIRIKAGALSAAYQHYEQNQDTDISV